MEGKRRSSMKETKKLRGRKNWLRWKRRRRMFLQRSNRSKNRSSREGVERQRRRAKTRFDRRNVVFDSGNG
jgi:hypothetical protein